jgi:hypothetical protein
MDVLLMMAAAFMSEGGKEDRMKHNVSVWCAQRSRAKMISTPDSRRSSAAGCSLLACPSLVAPLFQITRYLLQEILVGFIG